MCNRNTQGEAMSYTLGDVKALAELFSGECLEDCETCIYKQDDNCVNLLLADRMLADGWRKIMDNSSECSSVDRTDNMTEEEAIKRGWRKVVLCKDCRFCKFNKDTRRYRCHVNGYFSLVVFKSGYCFRAEKRVVEENG